MTTDENCLFCKIVAGDIPAETVYEDEKCLAFRDINPQAPEHILLIPRKHIPRLDEAEESDRDLLGHMMLAVGAIARQQGIVNPGFRTVINCGDGGGQEVYHIHIHIMGGRRLTWPPG
jgi:histidine triad (HIT) family protein